MPNQSRIYGVAKQEHAKIKCTVDANPPDVVFKWTFNNSAESLDVAANHITRIGMYLIINVVFNAHTFFIRFAVMVNDTLLFRSNLFQYKRRNYIDIVRVHRDSMSLSSIITCYWVFIHF